MRRVSRRGLLTSGAAAGVLAASGLPLAAQARRGGVLRAGLHGASAADSWDAREHSDFFMIAAGQGAVFDTLTEVAADGSLKGELATGWQASPDARRWVFDLRGGVRFHNGKGFGAEDVIASLQMHRGGQSPARPLVETIAEMQALGPRQVAFTLHAGNADFPYLLADYHLLIYPAGQIEEAIAQGIGTGLYRVESFEPGRRLVAKRVADHYKDGQAGWFDGIEYLALNDTRARTEALLSGRVEAISRVDPAQAGRIEGNRALRLREVAGNQHYGFPMRTDLAPFDALNLRQALKHAIDRQAILDEVLMGRGRIASDSPIGPANQYFDAALAPLPHDPDRARYHLRQAGLEGVTLPLGTSEQAFPGAGAAAGVLRRSAAEAGLAIEIRDRGESGDWSHTWREAPFRASSWSGRVTEDWMFSTVLGAGAPWNETAWGPVQNARFQELLPAARAEFDSMRRREMYHEMQRILRDEGGMLVPVFAHYLDAVSTRIGSPDRTGNLWQMDNARMAERWWTV